MPKTSENFIRPFIRWAGGKQNLVKYLLQNLPDEHRINKYWEPFVGAGSLFFSNGFTNAEISDVNEHLINAYRQIRSNPQAVYRRLQDHKKKFNAEYYYQLRQVFNQHLNQNTIEQAARFIFLVHTCFNGMYRVNAKGEYNVPIGKMEPSLPTIEHLKKISLKLQNIQIVSRSYEEILPLVKHRNFVYIDPPYPKLDKKKQFQQYTIDRFSENHQTDLANFANNLHDKGCFVMISNSDVPLIKELYNGWNIQEVPVVRYISCKKERIKVNELIIKNY
ncbi:MAG TPA: Dam family site-specific DNA-(adenine-N6)-methyltransferase [Hanamia sp.]|nr:Dam family site-specific DNA-(adenine-N6)-methyltransferase [Hanamia sp.]